MVIPIIGLLVLMLLLMVVLVLLVLVCWCNGDVIGVVLVWSSCVGDVSVVFLFALLDVGDGDGIGDGVGVVGVVAIVLMWC